MAILDPSRRLRKELSLLDVYAISLGATLSSGFFLLPGLAAAEAGPAVVVTYIVALLPLLPGILSKVELSTAMPRAGGVYYFLDRSIGPGFGTIGGIGTWLALILKVSFALVGMGAYLGILWPGAPTRTLAVAFAVAFGFLNMLGAARTGRLQVVMVLGLLALLVWFVAVGAPNVEARRFDGFFDVGADGILGTAGLVCVSYIGLTKIASISEEVKRPERTLPRGMFLAVITASVIYVAGTWVMVGVLPREMLYGDLTPVATTAERVAGHVGAVVMTVAALLAFFSVANAGIMSASRYPLAMSRDRLMPSLFERLGRFGTPTSAIAATVAVVVLVVTLLDPLRIAKLAGAFQLLLFALNCVAVIIMREARLASYDPGYRAPFYPWLQIVGIVAPFVLIAELGWMAVFFTAGLITVGWMWFVVYGRRRVTRVSALRSLFSRVERAPIDDLDRELRSILKEKGLREQDPFDEVVVRCSVIDAAEYDDFEVIVRRASALLGARLGCPSEHLITGFLEGTRTGATPVTGGIALPHMRLPGIEDPQLVVVRCRAGLEIELATIFGDARPAENIQAIFFLVSPDEDPGQHLRLLAELASRVDQDDFMDAWLGAEDERRLKEILLRHDRCLTLSLELGGPVAAWIGRPLREVELPPATLVAIVHRGAEALVPGGSTILAEGDSLTVIGEAAGIDVLRRRLGDAADGAARADGTP